MTSNKRLSLNKSAHTPSTLTHKVIYNDSGTNLGLDVVAVYTKKNKNLNVHTIVDKSRNNQDEILTLWQKTPISTVTNLYGAYTMFYYNNKTLSERYYETQLLGRISLKIVADDISDDVVDFEEIDFRMRCDVLGPCTYRRKKS